MGKRIQKTKNMKKLYLLAGNGLHNRNWIEDIQRQIGGNIQYYQHWEIGAPELNFDVEARVLRDLSKGDPVLIFAKSAGCLVTMKAVYELGLQVERAVFVGTAVNFGLQHGIPVDGWLKEWRVPTLFVHKENDKVIAADELRQMINENQQTLILSGKDHDYLEFDQYLPQVKGWLVGS